MPDVSIITPVLNQASTIEACIESVASQNAIVEHIIIDGGSSDGTVDLIQKHASKLAFWVSEKDRGQSHAINKGLDKASGKFFNWLNADDRLTKGSLKKVLQIANSASHVVVGKCDHVNANGERIDTGSARIWESLEATLGNYSMGQPSVFYETEIVRDIGGLNENLHLCMDMELWFRFLLRYGQKHIKKTDTILSQFLVHTDSKTSKQSGEMRVEKYGIYNALLSNYLQPPVVSSFLSSFPEPKGVRFNIPEGFDQNELLSHFAWHLMVEAYASNNIADCRKLLDVVDKGRRLSTIEQLEWKARLVAAKVLRQ